MHADLIFQHRFPKKWNASKNIRGEKAKKTSNG